jgi:ribonucleoside-diphosphate reductase alpha chain
MEKDEDWDLVFEGKVYKTVKAKYLYDLLTKNAFEHNEPGILNVDTVHKEANSYYLYRIHAVNPCAEQTLPPWGVCDLGAINFSKFVLNPFEDDASLDKEALIKTIHTGVRFLDNVLDKTDYPLPQIKDRSKGERRIGLGFTGFADMLVKLKIKYGSEESIALIHEIGSLFRDESYRESIDIAKEKGSFPVLDREKFIESGFCKRLPEDIRQDILKYGIRNIAINTVAPTGTTSLSLGQNCSSGIEPIFSLAYDRTYRTGTGEDTKVETIFDFGWLEYLEWKFKKTY